MEIKGVTLDDFRTIVQMVSNTRYSGNVEIYERDAKDLHGVRAPRIRARLSTKDSRGPGARRSWNGRHMRAACWHAYRDVLAELFRLYPDAVVKTGMSKYEGRAGFLANYPATGRQNIGSAFQPATMPELCDCHDTCSVADLAAHMATGPAAAPGRVNTRVAGRPVPSRTQQARNELLAQRDAERQAELSRLADDERTYAAITAAESLLDEIAAQGWTNPHTDPDSPAWRLVDAR